MSRRAGMPIPSTQGERNVGAKLTDAIVTEGRALNRTGYENRHKTKAIWRKLAPDVAYYTFYRAMTGQTWRHLP